MIHTRSFSAAVLLCLVGLLAPPACSQNLDAPDEAEPGEEKPGEIRRGLETGGSREERARRAYERVIRKIEPTLVGHPDRLPLYVELFKREFVEDTRTFAFNVTAQAEQDKSVILTGWVEFDEHRQSLVQLLNHLGFKQVNEDAIEILPGPALCISGYAIVKSEPVYVYDKPEPPRETFTEVLPGDALFVLKEPGDDTLLVHAPDGYVGFLDATKVTRVNAEQFDSQLKHRAHSAERNERIEKAIAAAESYLGTKYVWGGRTKEGIDCSGLVHAAFRAAGVFMPRDADQQALVGTLVATRWHRSSLQRGDVLFFLGRRGTISHTALYLGDGKFIEASSPVVTVSNLEDLTKSGDKKRGDTFCFAKRVFE